jgi:hypothetical protein
MNQSFFAISFNTSKENVDELDRKLSKSLGLEKPQLILQDIRLEETSPPLPPPVPPSKKIKSN